MLVALDIYRYFFVDQAKKFENIYGENTNYFARLSNLEKKRWIAEELYYRKYFGIKLLSENILDKLKVMNENERLTISNDPPNYNILSN